MIYVEFNIIVVNYLEELTHQFKRPESSLLREYKIYTLHSILIFDLTLDKIYLLKVTTLIVKNIHYFEEIEFSIMDHIISNLE